MSDPLPVNLLYWFFDKAVSGCKASGHFTEDMSWQSGQIPDEITESEFLWQLSWVVLNSGFRNTTARKLWPKICDAFIYFSSAEEIVKYRKQCVEEALKVLNNKRKIGAMADAAEKVHKEGYEHLKARILADPIPVLREFSYMGPIIVYHMAKNMGFQYAKPDLHLVRVAKAYGYDNVQSMCEILAEYSGLKVNCVDLVIWRYCATNSDYINELPESETIT